MVETNMSLIWGNTALFATNKAIISQITKIEIIEIRL